MMNMICGPESLTDLVKMALEHWDAGGGMCLKGMWVEARDVDEEVAFESL